MRRLLLAALLVMLSACSYGELLETVEDSGGGDLTSEENPTDVQAAGSITEAKTLDEQAQEKVAESLDPELGIGTKIALANDAIRLRQYDPRYWIHRSWVNALAGDWDARIADLQAAAGLSLVVYGEEEGERRFTEFYLDATLKVMRTYADGSVTRVKMEREYCQTLGDYRTKFGSTALGKTYLVFAPTDLCS